MATVIVDSYAQTDGGYRNLQAQQGIDQAFLTLNFPDALGDLGTLTWNIGTFQNRYGTMGKYDGGMYETYIFGRTHITRRDADRQPHQPRQRRATGPLTLEHGVGAKIRHRPVPQQPELPGLHERPGRQPTNGSPYLVGPRTPTTSPTPGPVPQGSTFVHHAHVGAKYQKIWTFGAALPLHLDARRQLAPDQLAAAERRQRRAPRAAARSRGAWRSSAPRRASTAASTATATSATRTSTRATSTRSPTRSRSSTRTAATSSSRTSSARRTTPTPASTTGPQNETGTVDNIAFQYSFSFGALRPLPRGLVGRRARTWW